MGLFNRSGTAALDQRVAELETQTERLQRLVRLLVLAFLVLTAVVVLPTVLQLAGGLLLLAGIVFVVRALVDGASGRLLNPLRALYRAVRSGA